MKNTNNFLQPLREKEDKALTRGFTLMEILIVVLIIGILAAVALPQYQKAVLKSRYSALMPIAKAVAEGNEVHYMQQGQYATTASQLDIAGKDDKYPDGTQINMDNGEYSYVLAKRDNLPMSYVVYQKHSVQYPGEIHCEADSTNTRAQDVCKSFGATQDIGQTLTPNYLTYVLNGTGNGVAPSGEDGNNPSGEPSEVTCPEGATCDEEGNITQCPSGQTLNNGECEAGPTYDKSSQCTSWIFKCTHSYSTFKDGTICIGETPMQCSHNLFETGSTCNASRTTSGTGCQHNTFDGGTCTVNYGNGNPNGCSFNTFTNGAKCYAKESAEKDLCSGSTFTNNSRCYSNPDYGAAGSNVCGTASDGTPSTYDETSCCVGSYCPAGTSCAEKGLPDNP